MARNTLSRAERYHPKGKKTNYNKTVPFPLRFLPAYCVSRVSPLTHLLAKNLSRHEKAGSGSKVCFVSLIYSFIEDLYCFAFICREFPETTSHPNSGEQVSSSCKTTTAKSKHKRANKTDGKNIQQ